MGGGVIFGPKPRDYSISIPLKARRLALRSALSAKSDVIKVIKDFSEIAQPKTKEFVKVIQSLDLSGKILLIADPARPENQHLALSAKNIPNIKLILPSNLNIKDLIEADNILITESAINEITERLIKK